MSIESIRQINDVLWVAGNVLALVVFLLATTAAILYPLFFNVRVTTAGRVISRAILSVAAFSALAVIGLFFDSSVGWNEYPAHVEDWRPSVRFVIYLFIVFSFGSLVRLLVARRFWPDTLRTAPRDHSGLERRTPDGS